MARIRPSRPTCTTLPILRPSQRHRDMPVLVTYLPLPNQSKYEGQGLQNDTKSNVTC